MTLKISKSTRTRTCRRMSNKKDIDHQTLFAKISREKKAKKRQDNKIPYIWLKIPFSDGNVQNLK